MKAAIVTAYDPHTFKGGIETYTFQLVELLESRGVSVDIFHTGMVKGGHGLHNDFAGNIYLLGRYVMDNDGDYDLIICHSFYGFGYFPPRKKTVNIFHSTHLGFSEEFSDAVREVIPYETYLEWKILWGRLCESVSGYGRIKIAVSDSVREQLESYHGFKDVKVVLSAVDTGVFRPLDKAHARRKLAVPEDAFVGLYVGRWDKTKGCDIAGEVINKSHGLWWIIVAGTGGIGEQFPQAGNVRVVEHVEHKSMCEIYSASDFVVFPTRYEGFGYVTAEAMSCGVPVITANAGIAKSIYKDEPFKTLMLPDFSSGRETVVGSCIEKVQFLRDLDVRHYIGQAGRRLMEEKYDIRRWRKEMAEVLGV